MSASKDGWHHFLPGSGMTLILARFLGRPLALIEHGSWHRLTLKITCLWPLGASWTASPPCQMIPATPIVGAVMDIVVWLRSLGLGKYEALFRENDIDETVLLTLTAEDLKEVGVTSFGHRRKILDAIAALRNDTPA